MRQVKLNKTQIEQTVEISIVSMSSIIALLVEAKVLQVTESFQNMPSNEFSALIGSLVKELKPIMLTPTLERFKNG